MSQSINWDTLETQYFSDGHYRERLAKMVTIVDDSFVAGQQFAKHFNQSIKGLRRDLADVKHTTKPTHLPNISSTLSEKLLSPILAQHTDAANSNNDINTNIQMVPNNDQPAKIVSAGNAISSAISSGTTALMGLLQPSSSADTTIDTTKVKWYEREALQFMRGVMDECTHLKNFSVPYDTSLTTAICAKEDAYVPREGCASLEEVWPGAEVKYLDAGHVSAYVLHQKLFR